MKSNSQSQKQDSYTGRDAVASAILLTGIISLAGFVAAFALSKGWKAGKG